MLGMLEKAGPWRPSNQYQPAPLYTKKNFHLSPKQGIKHELGGARRILVAIWDRDVKKRVGIHPVSAAQVNKDSATRKPQ